MYIIGEEEIEAVAKVIRSGKLFRYGNGDECETFERRYAEYLGAKHVRLTCSGSYALHAAAVGLGLGPGDEVIVPAHTYMATATSVLSVGAIPIIVDIDESLTIDPAAIEDAIGPSTRAVIPVHLWGAACDMDAIMAIARKHELLVLEDACTGIGGAYEGRMLGTIGDAGAYSFNYYKNITAGEGGGVVTNDDDIDRRVACSIDPCHHYWTGRNQDMKPFADNGGRASEIIGAVLNIQLGRLPGMIEPMRAQRRRIVEATRNLDNLGLRLSPMNSPDHDVAAHVIYNLPSAESATTFAAVCPSVIAGKTGRHTYVDWDQVLIGEGAGHPAMNPYNMEANKDCRRTTSKDMCQRSLDILERTVMIPMNPGLSEADVEQTIRNIEAGARVAAGEITREQAEVKAVDKIDPRKYDADVAAYGLG